MLRSNQYLIRLPDNLAARVENLALVAERPKTEIIRALIEAGFASLICDRRIDTDRQWRGLILEYRARELSR